MRTTIIDETGNNWVTEHGFKVKKSAVYTEQQVNDQCFLHEDKWKIIDALKSCQDADVVRAVGELLKEKQ